MLQKTNLPKLEVINGIPYASSLDISNRFRVAHKNVMQAIEKCIDRLINQPILADFAHQSFIESTYKDKYKRVQKMYLLSEEGFAMSVFLFKTAEALNWQVKFLRLFAAMKKQLHEKEITKIKHELVRERLLPFGEPVVRDAISVGKAILFIRMLKRLPELTNGKLKGMLVRSELEGFQNERGHWQIYEDQITKLLGGER